MLKKMGAYVFIAMFSALTAAEKPLTLDDTAVQANPALQQDLGRRSSMLQWHQWLGIAALVPMVGTYILGTGSPLDQDTRTWHMALGISTATLYMTSAGFALFAPKPEGTRDTGSTKWHRYLSYVHFPLMIVVPILGNMARQQRENGEQLSGAASLHGVAASALLATYTASITILVFNF